jgi:divalent metal cation (Fe/Co/Zn/Cd) transporter
MHILVDGQLPLEEAHGLTEKVEESVKRIVHNADVSVHAEPAPVDTVISGQPQKKANKGRASKRPIKDRTAS